MIFMFDKVGLWVMTTSIVCCLGDVVVSVLATGPKVRGLNPAEAMDL
jgi:hypothetical protein